jgi:type VI secretion system VasD/TssJ family lipoprotein
MIVLRNCLFLSALILPLLVMGCGRGPMLVRAVSPVNVNKEGESLPVKVRIYALRDDGRFRSALFSDLWQRDIQALGDDRLQDPKVLVVAPRDPTGLPDEIDLGTLPQETRFIGILALYQQPDEPDRRRVVLPIDLVDERIVELVDRSIVVYVNGDPSPVRPIIPVADKTKEAKSEQTEKVTNDSNDQSKQTKSVSPKQQSAQ